MDIHVLISTQRANFFEDFVLEQNRLPDLELMDQSSVDTMALYWKNLRTNGYLEKAADLSVLGNQSIVDTFAISYSNISVKTALHNETDKRALLFKIEQVYSGK